MSALTGVFIVSLLAAQPADSGAKAPGPEVTVTADPNDLAYQIGKLLRCPVCQGMPIADSPADMAQSMMGLVRQQVAEGKSKDEVLDYFTQSYGDWVLLRPRTRGFSMTVWLLPPIGILLGLFFFIRYMKGTEKNKEIAPSSPAADDDTGDEYLRAVREEVQR